MTEKLNPIERALVAAAGMGPPDARSVLMLICQAGMTTTEKVEQPPSPGAIHYARREKIIKRTKAACDRVIDYAKHETLRKIEKHFRDTGVASAEGDEPKTLAEQLAFKKQRFSEEMAAVLREEATIALATAGQQLFDEVGAENVWKTPTKAALEYLDARENLFANASDEIHGEVMQQLQNGLEHGETKKELMARIGSTFDGIKQTRADTIANTETAAAFNFARDKAMREAGVTYKKWLHSQRPEQEPRPTHVENDGQTVPIDDPFDISGVKFMYPSDDSLGAGSEDIINCHCVAIPVEAPIEAGFDPNQLRDDEGKWTSEGVGKRADVWYDKNSRMWVHADKDQHGNQIGDAYYTGSERDALYSAFIHKSDEFWGIKTLSEETGAQFPYGKSALQCTGFACSIRQQLGPKRVQVYGFLGKDNPTSEIGKQFGGHDFAVVDRRYIVDPWIVDVESIHKRGVFDLKGDDSEVRKFYGNRSSWKLLPNPNKSSAGSEPTTGLNPSREEIGNSRFGKDFILKLK